LGTREKLGDWKEGSSFAVSQFNLGAREK